MLVSEIMLQHTRVEAVIPYFLAFLAKFPTAAHLAAASEAEVLTAWAGLGYYSRARNLRSAAGILAADAPVSWEACMKLPGVGPYTAAALASISLGAVRAAVDGNVMRVVSRLTNDPSEISAALTKRRFAEVAQTLLAPLRPGDFNQAMMELGATVCLPTKPRCLLCPVQKFCTAHSAGTQGSLPVKLGKVPARRLDLDLLVCWWEGRVGLVRRSAAESRLAGFWELPQKPADDVPAGSFQAEFTHQIVNDRFRVRVWVDESESRPGFSGAFQWFSPAELVGIPVTTIARKALNATTGGKIPCSQESRSRSVTQGV